MIRVVVDLKDNVELIKEIANRVGEILIEKMRDQLKEKDAIATGYLYNSFKVEVSESGGRVVNEAPYSAVLEFGCRPHTPPYDAILNWVIVKKGESLPEAYNAAWRVLKKIEREGYEGRYYARGALREVVEDGGKL